MLYEYTICIGRKKMNNSKRILNIIVGPVLFLLTTFLFPSYLTAKGAQAVGVGIWMIYWWVTRPVDITVTAILPVAANAVLNVIPMNDVISQYSNSSIILIFGSCLITAPWAVIGLDRRIALKALSLIGPSMKSQIIVWMIASTVLSNVMPNVVVVAIFTPIAVSMLNAAGYKDIRKCEAAVPILCAIAWGAEVGGAGTPLGGAMNVTAISILQNFTGQEFMYIDWLKWMLPYTILATIVCTVAMLIQPRKVHALEGTKDYFKKCYAELGSFKRDEKISLFIFILAMVLAFIRPLYADLIPGLAPAYVFLILGFINFFIIGEDKKQLLSWANAQKEVMWGMLILFAGGLALGQLLSGSGANDAIAEIVTKFNLTGGLGTVIIFAVFSCLISEMTNSTVSAAVTLPMVLGITSKIGLNPIPYLFVTVMALNYESLLPVSVRAISVGYGLDPNKLLKSGIPVTLARLITAIAIGYAFMKLLPGFGILS
jgi:sodium-dependent dicarboxylate transporter 2/3/5